VKALSLWQPWASLWICGRKIHETRAYQTSHRGALLVHAAKKICIDIDEALREICEDEFGPRWMHDLPAGALIGCCELVGCTRTEHVHIDAEERAQGNFTPGRWAWSCQNSRVFDRPIPYRGMQMLFEVPPEIIAIAIGTTAPAAAPRQGSLL
jgi:activating signal cointegrator 1